MYIDMDAMLLTGDEQNALLYMRVMNAKNNESEADESTWRQRNNFV